jgi:hypothetical protein
MLGYYLKLDRNRFFFHIYNSLFTITASDRRGREWKLDICHPLDFWKQIKIGKGKRCQILIPEFDIILEMYSSILNTPGQSLKIVVNCVNISL